MCRKKSLEIVSGKIMIENHRKRRKKHTKASLENNNKNTYAQKKYTLIPLKKDKERHIKTHRKNKEKIYK